MAKRFLFLLLGVLLALVACDYQPPVFVTATPDGLPFETVEPTVIPQPTSTLISTAQPAPATQTPIPTATDEPTPTPEAVERDCNRISYNVNGFAINDWNYLKQHLVNIRPCSVLLMDDSGRALELMELLPETLVIFRAYHWSDGDACLVFPPRAQVDDYIRVFTDKAREMGLPLNSYQSIALYGCSNEPSFGSDTRLQQILNAEIEFMSYAREKGITVVSGNWAVGTINEQHVEQGLFHSYLWSLADGRHYLGVHEYTTYFLPFGVGAYPRSCLIVVACVQRENWVSADYIRPERWLPSQSVVDENTELPFGEEMMAASLYGYLPQAQAVTGYLPPYWHLFRSLWLDIYAIEHGIPRPTKILTESFHDRFDDFAPIPLVISAEIDSLPTGF